MKTFRFRLKNPNNSLIKYSDNVNFVWNYCNEVSHRSITYNSKWLSFYELCNLTSGCSIDLNLHSQCIREVTMTYSNRLKSAERLITEMSMQLRTFSVSGMIRQLREF